MTTEINNIKSNHTNSLCNIPVRNIWLLMLYASDAYIQAHEKFVDAEENPDKIPDLVAELLVYTLEKRLKRNLTSSYYKEHRELTKLKGKIDILTTERKQLLKKAKIACIYEDLTINTTRNRFILYAVSKAAELVKKKELRKKCLIIANTMKISGISNVPPSNILLSTERFYRNDADDRQIFYLAKLMLDFTIPTETSGLNMVSLPHSNLHWFRLLFEKAIAGIYKVALSNSEWTVTTGVIQEWPVKQKSSQIDNILPRMKTDMILENTTINRKIVIDTKFTSLIKKGYYREESLSSAYLYQMYAYLRTQESSEKSINNNSEGVLIHPAVGQDYDEFIILQDHKVRFITVNLTSPICQIKENIMKVI